MRLNTKFNIQKSVQFSSVTQLYPTLWDCTNSQSLLKLMSIASVIPSNHLILCCPPFFCLQSSPASGYFLMNWLFTSGGQSIGASASASVLPMNNSNLGLHYHFSLSYIYYTYAMEYYPAIKNRCFQIVVLENALESPLDSREIKLVNPKGNQPWIFIGRTDAEPEVPVLWPPDGKNWLIGKDPDAGKDWQWEEKGMTENEMVGWHHRLHGHELE